MLDMFNKSTVVRSARADCKENTVLVAAGVEYSDDTSALRALGISLSTLRERVSNNDKVDYYRKYA